MAGRSYWPRRLHSEHRHGQQATSPWLSDGLTTFSTAGRIQKWSPKAALNTGVLPNGMPCKYVSRNDLQFLHNEVYVKRTYLQHGIRLEPGDTVLDVGANIGFFAMQAAEVSTSQTPTSTPLPTS